MTKKRNDVLKKLNGRCWYCGLMLQISDQTGLDYFEMDHVIPRCRGGSDEFQNLVPSCKGCNRFKRDMPANFVRQRIAYERGLFEIVSYGEYPIQRAPHVQFYAEEHGLTD